MAMQQRRATQFLDSNGGRIWEFDRIQNTMTGERATVIFRDRPDSPGVAAYALSDSGEFCELWQFGFFVVNPMEKADQGFCAKYDYRRHTGGRA